MKRFFLFALGAGFLLAPAAHGQTTKPRPAPRKPTAQPTSRKPAPKPAPVDLPPANPAAALVENISFPQKPIVANLGLGIGNGFGYGFSRSLKSGPAVTFSLDKGLIEGVGPGIISVGGLVGYQRFSYDYPGTNYQATWKQVVLLARGAYHYRIIPNPKLDTYGGISLGVRHVFYHDTYPDNVAGGFTPDEKGGTKLATGLFVGARYYIIESVGAFAELGYDMSYLKLGLSARF